ncbi:MAG: SPFH/Band 7/PHB domain protein [Anaerolineae bacterium]|nr:SPFH/Band 7/PHB domain protein [Anaerolineae bacterium]
MEAAMSDFLGSLFAIFVILVLLVPLAAMAIRIVREYQRLVVFRLGRAIGQKGPGVVFIIPFIDRTVTVDLREIFLEIPKQTCITRDNAPIDIDFLIYYKVTDPVATVVQVGDFAGASQGIAITTLRAVIGDILLDDVLAKREDINRVLRVKLDEVTERWGVKVTSVEIREITPPREVQTAMNRQLAAERERRAVVTEADGKREAQIKVADGDRQGTVLRAQGDREAAILKAEGFALALDKVYNVARTVDQKTMSLQYLDALTMLGNSPATKFVVPVELMSLLKPVQEYAQKAWQADAGGDGGGQP